MLIIQHTLLICNLKQKHAEIWNQRQGVTFLHKYLSLMEKLVQKILSKGTKYIVS